MDLSMSVSHGDVAGRRHNIEYEYRLGLANVDPARSEFNEILIDEDLAVLYEREFGAAVRSYNERQTRADRKIDDYLEKIESSKQEKPSYELVVQIGNRETNPANLPSNRKLSSEIYKDWLQRFMTEFPNLKVYQAAIHMDELTPHLHVAYVPVSTGNARGLTTKNSLSGAYREMGYSDVRDANKRMFEMLEEVASEHEVERVDMECRRGRYNLRDFKAMAEIIAKEFDEKYHNDPALVHACLGYEDLCKQYQEILDKQNGVIDYFINTDVSWMNMKRLKEIQQQARDVKSEVEEQASKLNKISQSFRQAIDTFTEFWHEHVINPVTSKLQAIRKNQRRIDPSINSDYKVVDITEKRPKPKNDIAQAKEWADISRSTGRNRSGRYR